jgi:dolichol-phosphate mannosyltransferase
MKEREEGSSPSILVLMAALNEEEGIGLTISEFKRCLGKSKFLVVDGNSKDGTVNAAKGLGADAIFQEGKGKGRAIAYALGKIGGNFDYILLTDADYTYPASYVPRMIEILEKDPEVGMVCGNRFNSHFKLDAMHNLFYFGNRILAYTHNLLNGIQLRDPLTGLRLIRWRLLRNWRPKSKGFDIEVEMNHHIERRGFKIAEIEIPYRPRLGEKKLKLKHGFTIFKRIFTESLLF